MMKHFFKILFSVLFFATTANAQYAEEWRTIDSISNVELMSKSILGDAKGNTYATGFEYTTNSQYLQKRDAAGFLQWKKYYTDSIHTGWQRPTLMKFDIDSNIVIIGQSNQDPSLKDVYLTKYNRDGDLMFAKKYGDTTYVNEVGRYLNIDESNNIFLTILSDNSGDPKVITIKTDSSGNILYQTEFTYLSDGSSGFYDVILDSSHNTYIPYANYYNGNQMVVLAKFNSSGSLVSNDSIGLSTGALGALISSKIDNKRNIIVIQMNNGSIFKYDTLGNELWSLNTPTFQYYSFVIDDNDNIYITGSENDSMKIRKIDSSGNIIWSTLYSPPVHTQEFAQKIIWNYDGELIVTGVQTSTIGMPWFIYEITLVMNTSGDILKSVISTICSGNTQIQQPSVCVDQDNNIYHFDNVEAGMNYAVTYKLCAGCENNFTGTCFNDANQNCTNDITEIPLSQRILYLTPENTYSTTDANGNYFFAGDSGAHTITQLIPNYWSATCGSNTVSFSATAGMLDTFDFGSYLSDTVHDLHVSYGAYGDFNPGFNQYQAILYSHTGSTSISNATLSLNLDTAVFQYLNSVPPPDAISGNLFTWNLPVLNPGSSGYIHMETIIPSSVPFNTESKSFVSITPLFANEDSNDNSDTSVVVIVSSYDPNLKSVTTTYGNPNNPLSPLENELAYQINFQNTGTDTATLVRINDTLDSNLDISTIRFGASSHPYTWNISGPGILCFTFENILLPDSNVNELASHGFVKYYIKPKSNLDSGTVIENQASIYFDFNPPVLTNTVYYPEAPVINSVFQSEISNNLFKIFPNPNSGKFTVKYSLNRNEKAEFILYNLLGVSLEKYSPSKQFAGENHFEMDLSSMEMPNGIYFLECKTETHKSVSAISVMR